MLYSVFQPIHDKAYRFKHNYIHFLQLHYVYIAFIIFLFSGLYYCQPGTTWDYIDALYMATTGCTNTGTNTIAISKMSAYQVLVLYMSSIFGSHIIVSLVMVIVRKHFFSKRFREVVLFNKARKIREIQRRRHSSNSRPNINTLLQSNTSLHHGISVGGVGDDDTCKKEQGSQFDTALAVSQNSPLDGNIIGPYPLTMPLEHQHEHHLQQLLPDSRAPKETSHQSDIDNDNTTPTTTTDVTRPIESNRYHHRPTDSGVAETTSYEKSHLVNSRSSLPTTGGANIIFADNIMQQRESARQRLEAQRKLEEEEHDLEKHSPTAPGSMDGYHHHHNDSSSGLHEHGIMDSTDILSLAHDQMELTKEQRYMVGGAEYRALDLLIIVIPIYYLGIVLGASFAFRIYIAASPYAQSVLLTENGNEEGSINPWFFSFFICLSSMNNLGLSQIDASMVPFNSSPFPLFICGFLILAGNTAYPIFLRFALWCLYRVTPSSYSMHRETLRYLLDHPRRCYTTLFPGRQTWWLLVTLIAINLTEVVVYLSTNFWLPVMEGVPAGTQFLISVFQAVATRNAGFTVVDLGLLNPGTILVYIVAMYIGVYPVAISMRNSNVYQERSLGMYRTENEFHETDDYGNHADGGILLSLRKQRTISSMVTSSRKLFQQPDFFVMTQIQRQLTKDICWVIIGIFCVCVLEAQTIMSPSPINIATVIYECVSAFGCVGGSFGGTKLGTSQSADYQAFSKLVIILLMYRGRHRGLPASIDRAVLLPSEQLERSDTEEQHLYRLHRSPSCVTSATATNNNSSQVPTIKVYQRSETL